MSLEESLLRNTTAINALLEAVKLNTQSITDLYKLLESKQATAKVYAPVTPTVESYSEPETVKPVEEEPKPEPKRYVDNCKEVRQELADNYGADAPEGFVLDPSIPDPNAVSQLPEGERNHEYYIKHVQPALARLSELAPDKVRQLFTFYKMEATKRGVEFKKMSEVPPQYWDELFTNTCTHIADAEDKLAKKAEKEAKEKAAIAKAKAKEEKELAKKQAEAEKQAEPMPVVEEEEPFASDEPQEIINEVLKTSGLPDGERDMAYYDKYVQPVLLDLVRLDKAKMQNIVRSYGVDSARKISPAEWDNIVIATKLEIETLQAGV